jgi:hypothetical protein
VPASSYALHINCGGGLVTVNGSAYDDDTETAGPARFHQSGGKYWAFSTTGNFMDIDGTDSYTWLNRSNPELFKDARISPTSLTYYAFCMGNGNYTVNLHFAEIQFADDQTYGSLGRRIFDIYIQVYTANIYSYLCHPLSIYYDKSQRILTLYVYIFWLVIIMN